jgi:hypothetical protein
MEHGTEPNSGLLKSSRHMVPQGMAREESKARGGDVMNIVETTLREQYGHDLLFALSQNAGR